MLLDVLDASAYCYTGGKAFDGTLPTVVLIHGAQNDHSVWALQARHLAHQGFSVLAVDLPGHGRSHGPARRSVEEMAAWVLAVLDAAGVAQAVLVGHSMGSLIALAAAHAGPARVRGLALLGSTYPMKVSESLLDAALHDEQAAIDMINIWSHSSYAQKPSCPGPGFSVGGMAQRLMQRMAARSPGQLLHTDFSACNSYAGGEAAAAAVQCPVLFICGSKDQMTPPRSAQGLHTALAHGRKIVVEAGHQMMAEQPDAVLDGLLDFLRRGLAKPAA
jgi:pimeloyl-ACP methyl ester carboxylesterase